MRTNKWWRGLLSAVAILGALVVVLIARSNFDTVTEADASPTPDEEFLSTINLEESMWWTYLGGESSAVLNLGPPLHAEGGSSYRRWALSIHLPNTSELLTCVQGILKYEETEPIWIRGSGFYVELTPLPGMPWGEVLIADDIESVVEGLD